MHSTQLICCQNENFNFQTVFMDASNPSPNQGWNESEKEEYLVDSNLME